LHVTRFLPIPFFLVPKDMLFPLVLKSRSFFPLLTLPFVSLSNVLLHFRSPIDVFLSLDLDLLCCMVGFFRSERDFFWPPLDDIEGGHWPSAEGLFFLSIFFNTLLSGKSPACPFPLIMIGDGGRSRSPLL